MANSAPIDTTIRVASMRQINAAIEHLHRGDFECAITLAAAAEGMLPDTDKPHFLQKVRALEESLKDAEGENRANAHINWLKHGKLRDNEARIETATISQLDVIVTIWRAISKFEAVYVSGDADRTPQMIQFANWTRERLQNSKA
jgi:hypothetical protein